jgi:hypothetical protein
MAHSDKNIVITPNISSSSDDPKIVFSGADASTGAQNITLKVYPTNSGTLSFEGSAGQLFSITNTMSGTIFSVNDISGVPSIEVLDTGVIKLAQYGGFVAFGTSSSLTATGSAQSDALAIIRPVNEFTTVAASTGTRLPAATAGVRVVIRNSGANNLKVYPASGAQINNLGTNAAFTLDTVTTLEYIAMSATQWYTMNAVYAG